MTEVEVAFDHAFREKWRLASDLGCPAGRTIQSLNRVGAVQTMKNLLKKRTGPPQGGFLYLANRKRLDLTFEALVTEPRFASLFTETEREEAQRRLSQA
jgi:hypothetical protein